MDKIIKPNNYENLSEIEKLRRRDVRKELYKLISKMSNNAVERDELYIKLYKTFKNITDLWNDPDNEILEWGFLALPRTLIWLHRAIGITSNELVFIITIHSLNDMGKKNILDREIAGYNFNNLSDEVLEEIDQVISFLKIKDTSVKEDVLKKRLLESYSCKS